MSGLFSRLSVMTLRRAGHRRGPRVEPLLRPCIDRIGWATVAPLAAAILIFQVQ